MYSLQHVWLLYNKKANRLAPLTLHRYFPGQISNDEGHCGEGQEVAGTTEELRWVMMPGHSVIHEV